MSRSPQLPRGTVSLGIRGRQPWRVDHRGPKWPNGSRQSSWEVAHLERLERQATSLGFECRRGVSSRPALAGPASGALFINARIGPHQLRRGQEAAAASPQRLPRPGQPGARREQGLSPMALLSCRPGPMAWPVAGTRLSRKRGGPAGTSLCAQRAASTPLSGSHQKEEIKIYK